MLSHFNEKTLNGYEMLPRCLSSFAISHLQSLVTNVQVFVLIPRLLLSLLFSCLFTRAKLVGTAEVEVVMKNSLLRRQT